MSDRRPEPVTGRALPLPLFQALRGRRVILASSSPNRKEAMARMGLEPEIIPSTFAEDLPHSAFVGRLDEYPIQTAEHKAIEVYERVSGEGKQPPDLVISGDTVVIYQPQARDGEQTNGVILEKPSSQDEQLQWLEMLNGQQCEVVSGVAIGPRFKDTAFPKPGEEQEFQVLSMMSKSRLQLANNPHEILKAYVESGEGMNKAAGFGVRGLGSILVEETFGDYHNCVGFPTSAFWRWVNELYNDGDFALL